MTSSGLKQHLATALHYLWSWQKNVLRIFQGVLDDTAPKGKKTAFDASKSCPSNWQKSWHYFMGGTSDKLLSQVVRTKVKDVLRNTVQVICTISMTVKVLGLGYKKS